MLLATDAFIRRMDWTRVHVLWGDERCVPPDDARSNYRMAREALLGRVPIPPGNIHRIHGEDNPSREAAAYERLLHDLLGRPRAGPHPPRPCDDGHTASLFPGHAAVREKARWMAGKDVAAVAMWRITLTPVAINAAHHVSFIVSGASKAECLRRVVEGPAHPGCRSRPRARIPSGITDCRVACSRALPRAQTGRDCHCGFAGSCRRWRIHRT